MADLSITAANVAMHATAASTELVTWGATVTQGQVVYKDTADANKYKLAQADGTLLEATAAGIVLTPGDANDKGYIAKRGAVDLGATVTVGEIYLVSATAGGICPEADILTSTHRVKILGTGAAADQLDLEINSSANAIP